MSLLIAILCLLFFGAVLLVMILNQGTADVNLFFRGYSQVPVAYVIAASLLAGIAFTSLISVLDGIRLRLQNRRLRREIARLERAIERSRALGGPASGPPDSEDLPPTDYPRD
jgi:uncharacterized integral membrane protein